LYIVFKSVFYIYSKVYQIFEFTFKIGIVVVLTVGVYYLVRQRMGFGKMSLPPTLQHVVNQLMAHASVVIQLGFDGIKSFVSSDLFKSFIDYSQDSILYIYSNFRELLSRSE
jgi:hypothetical protein